MSDLRRASFPASELELVPEVKNPCMMICGSPILSAESVYEEDGVLKVLCSWNEDREGNPVKLGRAVFHATSLYSLVSFHQATWLDTKSGAVLNESAALAIIKLRAEHAKR